MRKIFALLFLVFILSMANHPVQAAGTPPPDGAPLPVSLPSDITGFPWGLVVVFIVAGFIMTYIKKNSPNKITSTTCVPLIDEKKMEAEKRMIAEEEASQRKP
jgi:hypothetical protein